MLIYKYTENVLSKSTIVAIAWMGVWRITYHLEMNNSYVKKHNYYLLQTHL